MSVSMTAVIRSSVVAAVAFASLAAGGAAPELIRGSWPELRRRRSLLMVMLLGRQRIL